MVMVVPVLLWRLLFSSVSGKHRPFPSHCHFDRWERMSGIRIPGDAKTPSLKGGGGALMIAKP